MPPTGPKPRSERLTAALTLASALLCVATGATLLVAWCRGWESLLVAHRGYTPMQGNTALTFLLLGVSLLAVFFDYKGTASTGASLVIALAALTLLEYATGADLAIDHLVPHPVANALHSGRMAPNTAIALLAGAFSLCLLAGRARGGRRLDVAAGLSSCVVALGAVPLSGYLLGLPSASRWGMLIAMALPTACLFVVFGVGTLACAWRHAVSDRERVPRWLPASAFLTCTSTSVLLAGALWYESSTQGLTEEARLSLGLATLLTVVLGFGTAAGLAAVIHFAQHFSRRACELEELNRALDHEVEERRQAQTASERLNRALRMVSECNHALTHAGDESDLLQRICDLAVGAGGYRLAWIGSAEDDAGKSVRIAAKAGEASAYVEEGMVTWGEEERGGGPTGTAIRTNRPVRCDCFLTDPHFLPWRERALRFGLGSSLVVPLRGEAHALGALCIYAAEVGAFGDAETELFVQLADDLAFGLDVIRNRAARVAAEQQLRQASLYARSLLEASLDPLVTISREGRITDVNHATEAVTGLSREALIGTDFSTYFTDPERARSGYRQVFEEGFVKDYSLVLRGGDGRHMDVLYNASVFRNEAGEVEGVFAAARDITDRKRAEEELRRTSLYARSLIEASLDPLVTINREGKITDVNQATETATGLPRQSLIGTDFSSYFTEPATARRGYERVFAGGLVKDYPLTIQHASGRTTEVLYNSSVYRNEAGEVEGVFAAARDITERKRAEADLKRYVEELARSNAELQEFAFVASHDLQEPLRKITAFSERLRDRAEPHLDEVSRDYLVRMHSAADRMSRLIDSLLDYSRVTTRQLPLQEVDLAQLTLGVLADLEHRLVLSHAQVAVGVLPKVMGDPTQLRQLLQNLLANALKFHAPDQAPRVTVSAKPCGQRWEIACADCGIGFDPVYADRIFRPFQRLHGRNQYEGSGMGLAICRKIAQRHGSIITVHSQPGQGSTFTVSLPAAPSAECPVPSTEASAQPQPSPTFTPHSVLSTRY